MTNPIDKFVLDNSKKVCIYASRSGIGGCIKMGFGFSLESENSEVVCNLIERLSALPYCDRWGNPDDKSLKENQAAWDVAPPINAAELGDAIGEELTEAGFEVDFCSQLSGGIRLKSSEKGLRTS